MSDGASTGGFDGGSGGGFDSGSSGGFDAGSAAGLGASLGAGSGAGFDPGVGASHPTAGSAFSDPSDPMGAAGGHVGAAGLGSAAWAHDQMLHRQGMRQGRSRGGSGPATPLGILVFVVVAIIALVVFGTVASQRDDVYPAFPSGELVDDGMSGNPTDPSFPTP